MTDQSRIYVILPKMSNKKLLILVIVGIFLISILIIGSTILLISQYNAHEYAEEHGDCIPSRPNHRVVIQNDTVSPAHTDGNKCDTLTITNQDDVNRLVAFGPHENHVPYDGIKEQELSKGQSLTVTMVQTGNFRFHDHIHDEVQGTFTVHS